MRIVSLASGSKGNAYVVEQGGEALLVDCGLAGRTLAARLKSAFPESPRFAGVLLTHSHSDHYAGLAVFVGRHPDVPVYANSMTAEVVAHETGVDESAFACFENGQPFAVGPFEVSPFSVPHDASDPVGYLIRGEETYFHVTDLGSPLDSVGVKLAQADAATVESNHDEVLLRTSQRPPALIQRILGPRGHLSNYQACDLVRRFAPPRLKRLALAHLSQDCNVPHVAANAMRDTLREMGRTDVALRILEQDEVVEL